MAFLYALGVHLLLVLALIVSVNWKTSSAPQPVQAELWSSLPAERPATPTPPPSSSRTERAAEPSPSLAKPDIVDRQKAEPKKPEPKKPEAKPESKPEPKKPEAKKPEPKSNEALQKALEQQRRAELAKLGIDPNAKAQSSGKDSSTKAGVAGGAEQGVRSGAKAGYADAIRGRIRARIRFDPSRAPDNPEALFKVEQLPTGQISRITLLKSSGNPGWDEAVKRAIEASDPLPKSDDGKVERQLELSFRPIEAR